MSTVMPSSELLKNAFAFIKDAKADHPEKSLASILDEAGMRFNLSPLDCEALHRLFTAEDEAARNPAAK